MHLIGLILVAVLMVAAVMSGGSLMQFVNPPSILVTFVGGHAALYAVYGKDAFAVFSSGFAEGQPARGARIARAGARLYILAAWVGVLIGSIQMAMALDDMSMFGPAAGVCLLTILYGYMMQLIVWVPLETHMEEKALEKAS
jgi:flagellar motor component MotA